MWSKIDKNKIRLLSAVGLTAAAGLLVWTRRELDFFQPGSNIVELTSGRTLVTVVYGRLRIKRVRSRSERVEALMLMPVILKPGQYLFEAKKYTCALVRTING